jgi:toxin HigB-1
MVGMIRSFRSRALKALWERGDDSRLHGSVSRVKRVLSALNVAKTPAEMNQPGWYFHQLGGDEKGVYSVRITGNWRITWEWDGDNAIRVDYRDYH